MYPVFLATKIPRKENDQLLTRIVIYPQMIMTDRISATKKPTIANIRTMYAWRIFSHLSQQTPHLPILGLRRREVIVVCLF